MAIFRLAHTSICVAVLSLPFAVNEAIALDSEQNPLNEETQSGPFASGDVFSRYDGARPILGAGLFAPFFNENGMSVFFDGSLSAHDDGFNAASVGIGYRIQRAWGVLGLNGFFDVSETLYSGLREQIGLGAELATGRFRVGLNGYLPLDEIETTSHVLGVRLVGEELRMFGEREHFLKGADLEFGALAADIATDTLSAEIWANGKFESFTSDVLGTRNQATIGVEAVVRPVGLTGFSGSTLKLETGAQWDSETNDIAFVAGFNVSMALNADDGRALSADHAETEILSNRVRRRHGIKTEVAGFSELTYDHETDVALDTVFQPIDQPTLDLALTNTDALVIVDDPGTSFGPVSLNSDITLMGGSSTILVRGQQSGNVAAFTAPGSMPHFYNGMFGTGSVTTVSNNSSGVHIAGLDILGNGGNGLFFSRNGIGIGAGVRNIVIENNRMLNTTAGIGQGPFGGDVIIRNNYIEDAVLGLNLGSNLTGVLIEGNTFGNLRLDQNNTSGHAITLPFHTGNSSLGPVVVKDNIFFGVIPGSILFVSGVGYDFDGSGNVSTATNSISAASALCTKSGFGMAFTGTIGFSSGLIQDTLGATCY
ncbi:MAG: inverse autotransporter beta domain-containing protein [Hyphomicrobiales bacterium]